MIFSRAVLDVPGFIYIKESAHHIEAPRKFDITLVSQAIVLLDHFFIISVEVPEN